MKSFEDLCRDNYGRIYKYIFAMTGDRASSEDLLQDVFAVAWEKGDAFLLHENPPAFLYKTARNLALSFVKRRRRTETEALDESVAGSAGDLFDTLAAEHDGRIDASAYTGAVIGRLDAGQQALYTRRYIDRVPIREIAVEAGVAEPAMRMRLLRLRRDIRDIVSGLKLEDF